VPVENTVMPADVATTVVRSMPAPWTIPEQFKVMVDET
jgi:hypothetical protein